MLGKDEAREGFLTLADKNLEQSRRNRYASLSQLDDSKLSDAGFTERLHEPELLPKMFQTGQFEPPAGFPLPSPSPHGPIDPAVKTSFYELEHDSMHRNFPPPSSFSVIQPLASKEGSMILSTAQKPESDLAERMKHDFLESNESSLILDNRKKDVFEAPVPLFGRSS